METGLLEVLNIMTNHEKLLYKEYDTYIKSILLNEIELENNVIATGNPQLVSLACREIDKVLCDNQLLECYKKHINNYNEFIEIYSLKNTIYERILYNHIFNNSQ